MAARKGSRGPKVRKYMLTVNEETGEVLHTEMQDPKTGQFRDVGSDVSFSSGGPDLSHLGVPAGFVPNAVILIGGPLGDPGTHYAGGIKPITPRFTTNPFIKPTNPLINPRIVPRINPSPVDKRGK